MKLNVLERFGLLHALPEQGNYADLKIVRQLRENLSFGEEEQKELEFEELPDGRIKWKGEPEKEIAIGEKATDIIVAALKKLNDTEQLTRDHLSVYEKFVKE